MEGVTFFSYLVCLLHWMGRGLVLSLLWEKQAGLDEGVISNGWKKSMLVMAEKNSCRWINSGFHNSNSSIVERLDVLQRLAWLDTR